MSIHARTDEQELEALWDRRARMIDHYESLHHEDTDEARAKAAPIAAGIEDTERSLRDAGQEVETYAHR